MRRVLGPDFYDPVCLSDVRVLSPEAVVVSAHSSLEGRRPHEATAARHFGGEAFLISLQHGGAGVAAGMRAAVDHYAADLIVSVDVGSDTLSTGRETRATQTSFADHLTLAGLVQQEVPAYFGLAGYGVDGEMELSELDENLSTVLQARGLRGMVGPSYDALDRVSALHAESSDPVGPLVLKAGYGDFGPHISPKSNPFGEPVHVTPAAVPVWIFDPHIVADSVALAARTLSSTTSQIQAEEAYVSLGRIPETTLARFVDYGR